MQKFLFGLLILIGSLVSAAANEHTILVLGDSLSSAHRIAPESGWVALLAARLKTMDTQHTRDVVNASISGETTAGGLARLPALIAAHHPGIVLVELGANDGLRGLPIDEIHRNLVRILQISRDAGARIVLIGIELPVNYGTQYRTALRGMYRDVAHDFNVPLVPFLLDGVAEDPNLMQDDGLHPRAEAQPKVLENVWPVLRPVLGIHD